MSDTPLTRPDTRRRILPEDRRPEPLARIGDEVFTGFLTGPIRRIQWGAERGWMPTWYYWVAIKIPDPRDRRRRIEHLHIVREDEIRTVKRRPPRCKAETTQRP